ncbi:MAG: ABC transporter substrate-binding protein [Pseudomonadota bacterium]
MTRAIRRDAMASMSRRQCLTGLTALMVAGLAAAPAAALDATIAKAHVQSTLDEVLTLVRAPGEAAGKADAFRAILEKRAAMPQIARFAAGRLWNDMSADQQERYTDAFTHYVSTVYARRFQEYSGQEVVLGQTRDKGRRGIEVASRVQGGGQPVVNVAWVVSDRPGRTVLADIVIEGVSLAITQREEVAAIYGQQGNDPDKLIDFLKSI